MPLTSIDLFFPMSLSTWWRQANWRGELPAVFNQLAAYYEKEDELAKKVSEALMYPAIVATVAVIMVFV